MFLWFRRLVYLCAVLAMLWSASVYGLPWARAVLPGFCAQSQLERGFCSPAGQRWLERLDDWQRTVLQPLSRDARVRSAATEAQGALQAVEAAVREQVGQERMDAAIRGADIALARLESLTAGGVTDVREKLAVLPENARALLARVRAAFERLRSVAGATSRRAEEVSAAVEETKRALDGVLRVVPRGANVAPETTKNP